MPKLDSRNELTTPVLDDLLLIQDISDLGDGLTGTSKKIEAGTLLAGPSIFVAANDATDQEKRHANYVCDGVADDVQIQAAIDAAEAADIGIIRLSKGTFILTAQLALNSVQLVGATPFGMIGAADEGTALEAHSTFPGATSMIEIEGGGCCVNGIDIDGGNYADIGINAEDIIFLTVTHCYFRRFDGNTSQAIRCGGVLGFYLEKCNFQSDVDGYALDAQSTYGSSYYGVNVGHAIGCWFDGRGGQIRLDGIMHFYDCDFECRTWDANPIVEIGPNTQSQIGFFGCYWEIVRESFDIVMVHMNDSSKATFSGCQLDADSSANSVGILADEAYSHFSVTGTVFRNLVTGIEISDGAAAGGTFISGNDFVGVTTEIDLSSDPFGYTATHSGFIQMPNGLGFVTSGGQRYGNRYWSTLTSFDPKVAFIHHLNLTDPETLQPGLADFTGQAMVLYFHNANTTLDDAAGQFYLQSGADITPTAGVAILFIADYQNHWREVGDYSLRLLNDYTITNDNPDRAFDADTVAIAELADVVATLIRDLGMG